MSRLFERFSDRVNRLVGDPAAFVLALSVVLLWGMTGPLFHFSDTWQLVINTSTTIVTFLIGFAITNQNNRASTKADRALRLIERQEREHGAQLTALRDENRALHELVREVRDINRSQNAILDAIRARARIREKKLQRDRSREYIAHARDKHGRFVKASAA